MLSFMICLTILQNEEGLDASIVSCLLEPPLSDDPPPVPEDMEHWMNELTWSRLHALEELKSMESMFDHLCEKLATDSEEWEAWYNHTNSEAMTLPDDANELPAILQLLFVRILRPDRFLFACSSFVRSFLGEAFVNHPPFLFPSLLEQSTSSSPLLFILHPGVDPIKWIEEYAEDYNISPERGMLMNVSMGQGQEERALQVVQDMAVRGGWVLLQNIQLMPSWLPVLESKLESLCESANRSFRCFLSAEPPSLSYMKNLPEGLLQSCFKICNEPPSDLKANLSDAWSEFKEDELVSSRHAHTYKASLFALCFFHASILGRRRFSSGWSRPYGFSTGDLTLCADILKRSLLLDQEGRSSAGSVPWQDIKYLFGEIMYGGHITDFWDRRVNGTYLETIFNEGILNNGELV
jgi:dynein heavy chain